MKLILTLFILFSIFSISATRADGMTDDTARIVNTPYEEQKVIYEFFFDHPSKISNALYWIRAQLMTLGNAPYDLTSDFHDIKVIIHGTEIVTLAKNNYEKYKDIVERMKYYEALGVEFRVCAQSAEIYDYQAKDLQDFVLVVPSAITEIIHWQQKGYALVIPQVWEKNFSIEELR